jgi:hypothetical protein
MSPVSSSRFNLESPAESCPPEVKDRFEDRQADPADQTLQLLETIIGRSGYLARWRSLVLEGRLVPSYVVIGPRAGRMPIRLALLGGLRPSDFLSTIAVAKLLVELDLSPLIARDFALFGYPLANPDRSRDQEPDFETAFWKNSADPVIRFFERELASDSLDGMIAVRCDEPVSGFQLQVSSRIIAAEVLWHALELPQKIVALADEPIQVLRLGETENHSVASLGHLRPQPFSLIIRTAKGDPSENQIAAVVFTVKQILLQYRSLVRRAGTI